MNKNENTGCRRKNDNNVSAGFMFFIY